MRDMQLEALDIFLCLAAAGLLGSIQLADGDSGDGREIAGDERQDAGRQERDQARSERRQDADARCRIAFHRPER